MNRSWCTLRTSFPLKRDCICCSLGFARKHHSSQPLLAPSEVTHDNGTEILDSSCTSSTAFLPRSDPVVSCILHRAAEIQGYTAISDIEGLQLTSYVEGQQYRQHYDWLDDESARESGSNRVSTFFGILDADCKDCGTRFPSLAVDWSQEDRRWCELVECESHEGLTVKPLPGSVFFWRNLDENGAGDSRTLHAGLPVTTGRKVGINIWTRVPVS